VGPVAGLDFLERRNIWLSFSLDVIRRTGVHRSCVIGHPGDYFLCDGT